MSELCQGYQQGRERGQGRGDTAQWHRKINEPKSLGVFVSGRKKLISMKIKVQQDKKLTGKRKPNYCGQRKGKKINERDRHRDKEGGSEEG